MKHLLNTDLLALWSRNLNTGRIKGSVANGFVAVRGEDGDMPTADDLELINAVNLLLHFADDRRASFDNFRLGHEELYTFTREDIAQTEGRLVRSFHLGGIHPADKL